MTKKRENQHSKEAFDDLGDLDDLLGLNDKTETIAFQCIDCGCVDPVPDFVVGEFSYGLKKGEEVEMHCPACNGTMRRAKDLPEEN
jgi:hypothetical protein